MGFLRKLRRSVSSGKKLLEEILPQGELTLDDVVPHAPGPVRIVKTRTVKTKPGLGSRRDKRRRRLEMGLTRADRRMCEKMRRRDRRKRRRSRRKRIAAAAEAGN